MEHESMMLNENAGADPPHGSGASALANAADPPAARCGRYRWLLCALLFFATTINYMDRQVIAVLKPELEKTLGWDQADYGHIVAAFQAAYAAGYLLAGRLMDLVGVRLGFAVSVIAWSLAAMAHGLMRSVAGFCLARAGLGLSEGGNFPGSIKAIGEWFPRKERALATGIFNAGSNVGALVTPILAPWLVLTYGWPAAFYVTGALGFLWLITWLAIYERPERHPRLSPGELAYIRSDPPDPPAARIPWLDLLRYRQTWAFALAMFVVSPIWWFYLYWVPDFLNKTHGVAVKVTEIGPPMVAIYLMADVGSIGGGAISSWLLHRGWRVAAARKTAMLACALCVVPIFLAAAGTGLWVSVLLIGLAAAAHQGFSANLYTLVSDTVPRQAVSSVVGIGGLAGALAGMGFAALVGHILQWTSNNYLIPFAIASGAYLAALGIIQILLPRWQGMALDAADARPAE
jgi:ACS family hexuronate transporter-like MFS transporter